MDGQYLFLFNSSFDLSTLQPIIGASSNTLFFFFFTGVAGFERKKERKKPEFFAVVVFLHNVAFLQWLPVFDEQTPGKAKPEITVPRSGREDRGVVAFIEEHGGGFQSTTMEICTVYSGSHYAVKSEVTTTHVAAKLCSHATCRKLYLLTFLACTWKERERK